MLSREELVACFVKLDAEAKKAATAKTPEQVASDAVDDFLDFRSAPVSLDDARDEISRRASVFAKAEPLNLGGPALSLSRKLTDALDPRKGESVVPFTLSYTDNRTGAKDAFVAVGELGVLVAAWDVSDRWDASFVPSLGFDVNTQKERKDSTVSLAAPIRWTYVPAKGSSSMLHDALVTTELKWSTDRDFRQDVFDLGISVAPSSVKLGRAGLNTWFGGKTSNPASQYVWYWQPAIGIEASRVADAGGNPALQGRASAGVQVRAVPSVAARLTLPFVQQRLSLAAGYSYRVNVDNSRGAGFTTFALQFDLAPNVALTTTYRHGRKPPDFSETSDVLLGIGLIQVPK